MIFDCIIIGAGAAGLYAGTRLNNLNVLILEKNVQPGKKILAAGSGQCNFTHSGDILDFFSKYGKQERFVRSSLSKHDNKAVIRFFSQHGVDAEQRPDGKVFPKSMKSSDVLNALLKALPKNVTLKLGTPVKMCYKGDDCFEVVAENGHYKSRSLIIATGGQSYQALGTTGDGYEFAKQLGLNVLSPKPGLTALKSPQSKILALQGMVLLNTQVSIKGRSVKATGDLLVTHFGLSGPVILDNSRYFEPGDVLLLNFVSATPEAAESTFLAFAQKHGDKPLNYYMNTLGLMDRLKHWILQILAIDGTTKLAQMDKQQRKRLIAALTQYEVPIESLGSFKEAMVTVGGVDVKDINAKTMAAKGDSMLHCIGEVLDVDGDTGGYNLQWAFSSAATAATHILDQLNKDEVTS